MDAVRQEGGPWQGTGRPGWSGSAPDFKDNVHTHVCVYRGLLKVEGGYEGRIERGDI